MVNTDPFWRGVQRPELRRPFKHGLAFLRPFYGVFTAVDKRPKLRPRKPWVMPRVFGGYGGWYSNSLEMVAAAKSGNEKWHAFADSRRKYAL